MQVAHYVLPYQSCCFSVELKQKNREAKIKGVLVNDRVKERVVVKVRYKEEMVQVLYYLHTSQFPSYIMEYKISGKRSVTKQTHSFPCACTTGRVNYHNLKITYTSTCVYIPSTFILISLNIS